MNCIIDLDWTDMYFPANRTIRDMLIEEDKIAVIRAIRQHKGWMVKETVDFVNSHWDKWIKIV